MPTSDKCDFCSEFEGKADNAFADRYAHALKTRVILETDAFKVLPSLGQMVPGYLLVVPKLHCRALGDLDGGAMEELETIRSMILGDLEPLYGPYVFFEHGTRTADCGGCGITHAHLHAVPFSGQDDPVQILRDKFPYNEVKEFAELPLLPASFSYLYYEAASRERYVFYPSSVPSQYMRQLLANAMGIQGWDWRQCGTEEDLTTTLFRVSQALAGRRR